MFEDSFLDSHMEDMMSGRGYFYQEEYEDAERDYYARDVVDEDDEEDEDYDSDSYCDDEREDFHSDEATGYVDPFEDGPFLD